MATRKRARLTKAARYRLVYALSGIAVVLAAGSIGFHLVAGLDAVNSFYYESMLATGQGPPFPLTTNGAKIFTSIMAFISVGSVVSTLLFAIGPVVRQFWHNSLEYVEEEVRTLEHEVEGR